MEALKIIGQYWEQLKRFGVYAQYCVEGGLGVPACHDFWTWSAIAAAGFGLLVIALIARRLLREQLEFYRNRKRLEARKVVASEDVMREVRWKDE